MLKLPVFLQFALNIVLSSLVLGQTPEIGLRFTNYQASEGYTLFSPEKNNFTYLIDNCGKVVHEWEFSEKPGLSCYLLENGNLLRAGKDSLEIRDWDNNLVWSYATTNNGIAQHHDIEPLPNGNILCVVADVLSGTVATSIGRDPSLSTGNLKLDKIIELQPVGINSANIVWEWRFQDHLVQDFDSTKANFGVVQENSQLLDINYDNNQPFDYIHINSVDYNVALDQIMMSSRFLNEIYIVDHSTSTFEAMGHQGGNSGKGGDFLWRWGNDAVFKLGDSTNQKLFYQHDAKWVRAGCPDEGKITVFNNGGDGSFTMSSIVMLEPPVNGYSYDQASNVFLPTDFSWSWNGTVLGDTLYEFKKSGAIQLRNGDMLICSSTNGELIEIDQTGNLVWSYRNPIGSVLYAQSDSIPLDDNSIFRGERYPLDYPGFIGKDLTPTGIIEDQNVLSESCFAGINEGQVFHNIHIENPAYDDLHISGIMKSMHVKICDISGDICFEDDVTENFTVDLRGVAEGILFIDLTAASEHVQFKVLHLKH